MWVTREELADALSRASITVRDKDGLVLSGASGLPPTAQVTEGQGKPKYPDEVAEGLLDEIARHRREESPSRAEDDSPEPADPELSAMAVVTAQLEPLDMEAHARVLHWLVDRFHVDL